MPHGGDGVRSERALFAFPIDEKFAAKPRHSGH